MSADPQRVATARQLLAQLGVTLADLRDDLRDDLPPRPATPTVAEYLSQVVTVAGSGARRTYGSYWTRMAAAWGSRPLDTIAATDIEAMQQQMAAIARSRRNTAFPERSLSLYRRSARSAWLTGRELAGNGCCLRITRHDQSLAKGRASTT